MLAKAKLIQARAGLVAHSPFLGTLALQLPVSVTEDARVPTAAISSSGACVFHAEFLERLSLAELRTILLHETLHLALDCFQRRGNRDRLVWNMAHDVAVNLLIAEEKFGFAAWPEGFHPLLDSRLKGLPAERIYDLMLDAWRLERERFKDSEDLEGNIRRARFDSACSSCSSPGGAQSSTPDEIRARWSSDQIAAGSALVKEVSLFQEDLQAGWDALSEEERKALRQKWGDALISAAEQASRYMGWDSLPGWAQKLLGPLLKPQLPWPQILKSKIHGHLAGARRTFARPGRRGLGAGLPLPGRLKDRGLAGVFVDVSGSVDEIQLAAFLTEVEGILQEADQDCRLLTWDAAVQEDVLLDRGSSLREALSGKELRLQGGGGTDPRCVISHLEEDRSGHGLPHFGVLLTDGYVPWPRADAWPLPLIVISTRELPEPGFGYEALLLEEGKP